MKKEQVAGLLRKTGIGVVNLARRGVDRAKVAAGKAKTEAKARVSKALDENARLSDFREKTEKFKAQTHDQLIQVRATIASAKNDPKATVSTAKTAAISAAISAAVPHVQKVTDSVKIHTTRAQETIIDKAGETRKNLESRAVGIFAHAVLQWARNPETFANLRTELSENLPGLIKSKAQEVNSKGLSPQRQLRETLAPEGLDGIKAPAFEAVVLLADRVAVLSGWIVTSALSRYLLLSENQAIEQADVNSIITGKIVAPTLQFAGKTAGTIYQHAHDVFQSRFTSGSTPPATGA